MFDRAFCVLCFFLVPIVISSNEPTRGDKDFYSVTYDLSPLLYKAGERNGWKRSDDIITHLQGTIDLPKWNPREETINVVNGRSLVVRTSRKQHEKIHKHLKRLEDIYDAVVDMRIYLLELDKEKLKKLAESIPESQKRHIFSTLANDVVERVTKGQEVYESSTVRIADSLEWECFSLKKALFIPVEPKDFELHFIGITVKASARPSKDRRQVILRTNILVKGKIDTAKTERPRYWEIGKTETHEVDDAKMVGIIIDREVFGDRDKEAGWLIVLQPRIYIASEEKLFNGK